MEFVVEFGCGRTDLEMPVLPVLKVPVTLFALKLYFHFEFHPKSYKIK